MATWAHLPIELITEILSHLPRTIHLKAASLVCSQLRGPSQRLLNQSIVVDVAHSLSTDGLDTAEGRDYTRLSEVVDHTSGVDGGELDPWRKLLVFLSTVLRHPKLFKTVRTLKVRVDLVEVEADLLQDWKSATEESNLVHPAHTEVWGVRNSALSMKVNLILGASSVGISEAYVTSTPLSAALLTILHLLPSTRHLEVSHPDAILLALTPGAGGLVPGGLPSCLQTLHSLSLGKGGMLWCFPPLPLLFALPNLHSFQCYGWDTEVLMSERYSSGHSQLPQSSSIALPRIPHLSRFSFKDGELNERTLVEILSVPLALKHLSLELKPPMTLLVQRHFSGEPLLPEEPVFDSTALLEALKFHSHSLRSLSFQWALGSDSARRLRQPGTVGRLDSFTSLKSLVIPAWMLFTDQSLHDVDDPESFLPMYLPPSLEYLNLFLGHKRALYDIVGQLDLQRLWPSIKAKSFPKLETFYLECEQNADAYPPQDIRAEVQEFNDSLAEVGITIWPPLYVFFIYPLLQSGSSK